ncbi:putative hydrolase NDAI_0H01770 [Naumovozyma dairenensis CBS 421]|uniref:DUF676 domain-containing protein n=1 Tax=Naumovozyma dairenensis (strain ATCC 10597 / BCRC 20456 / CBS 421 / NBRC 0211 / NRRL Y-12639) TaxID=1071378 RepID=G0WEZ0_NAUDC|nr:hypothetical protein NDAI_0H01770 [Naumovozyma dairenensis CBS 421]CCD26351.1 hypothetical protein NDAI_0H01770 [Naumovozyma dairenensis CBS 421]
MVIPTKSTQSTDDTKGILLFNDSQKLGIGDLSRYKITLDKKQLDGQGIYATELFIRIKNEESPLLRPVYITGPYAFYVDIRPHNYHEDERFDGEEEIAFCEDLKPDERFKKRIFLNEYSRVEGTDTYSWTIDIISQLAVLTHPKLEYSIRIATTRKKTKKGPKNSQPMKIRGVDIKLWDTTSLWDLPPKFPERPVHLVMMTHGIFSNIGCDMLYMKDKIEEITNSIDDSINPNVVVRGCIQNMGKSSYGVHYLGKKVALYIIELLENLNKKYKVDKISFIGHSLGGPTQSMAVHYLSVKRPDIFDPQSGIKPINFITLASPFIGVIGDFPLYVSMPLDFGALGLTGRDLNLKYTPLTSKDGLTIGDGPPPRKLIMEILPEPPALAVFERFIHRTLYANIVHDGIVPLRTAALLYLDWNSLAKVKKIQKKSVAALPTDSQSEFSSPTPTPTGTMSPSPNAQHDTATGEIPSEDLDKQAALKWALPQAFVHSNKVRKFKRGQVIESEEESTSGNGSSPSPAEQFKPPPEASTMLSALSVLTAPVPSQRYIKNPALRSDAVVHDKMYYPEELPPPHYEDRPLIKKVIYPNESINRIQERIARKWQLTMPWRKVLVKIKPDSHNNIVVRRRFVNLYGNVAILHMVQEHFGPEACEKYSQIQ